MKNFSPIPVEIGATFHTGAVSEDAVWRVLGVYAQVIVALSTEGKRRTFSRSFVAYRLMEENRLLSARAS